MSNLTTRKIVLGMLMVLVLAFSVQGTADAISRFTRGSGDLQLHAPGDDFTISFRVGVQSPSIKAGFKRVPSKNTEGAVVTIGADTPYYEDTGDVGYQGETQVSYSDAYNYDQEAISIAVTGATLTKVGTYDVDGAPHPMSEGGGNAARLTSSSVTLTLTAAAGTVTITITDTTVQGDRPANVTEVATPLAFTVFIAPTHNDTSTIEATEDLDFSLGEKRINDNFSGLTNARVNYTVSGSGSVYVKIGDRKGSGSRNLTTSSEALVFLDMGRSTNRVTASIVGQRADRAQSVTYIYGSATLTKDSGDKKRGAVSSRLANPLVVRVTDGNTRGVSGVQINFTVSNNGGGSFLRDPNFPSNLYVPETGALTGVKTNSSGLANVLWVLGASGVQTATATLVGATRIQANPVDFTATFGTETSTASSIVIESGDGQRADEFNVIEDPLVVTVRDELGQLLLSASVEFLARDGGTISVPGIADPGMEAEGSQTYSGTASRRVIVTDSSGQASVRYSPPQGGARRTVSAGILGTAKSVLFTVNGAGSTGGGGGGGDDDDADVDTDIISFSRTSITGEAGDEEEIRVTSTPSGVVVSLSSPDFANSNFSPQSETTPFTMTLTLPDDTGAYDIFATRSGFTPAEGTVTVEAEGLGTLTISPSGTAVNGEQRVNITARTSGGAIPAGAVPVTLSGSGFTTTRATVLTGTVSTNVTLPTTAGTYRLTASATGYNSTTTLLTVRTTTTPRGPAGVADSVEIDGQRQRSGTVNQVMRLRVRVLDANDNGVSDVRVTFRVLAPGRGRLSDRGNGRATQDQTDRNGYASANFTPSDDGNIIVRATAAGVRDPVTFIIAVGEAADDDTEPSPPSRDEPTSRDISPVVHVGVSSRPPMLWVDGGAIYALVGASAQRFAPSVDNAMNIAIGGGKVYWTEKTGDAGTINSANLNGSDVTELTSIKAVPMGIAVDVAGSKLYWTNSRGRIQSANLDGSGITNVIPGGLESPMDLALAGSNLYWTQGNGSVRVVNLRGQQVVRNVSTGTDTPGSVVVGGNKVYWTEMTGDSSGTINSANLSGTDVKELTSIRAVPMGIAVDGSRSKLYWTNSRGRVQSANLDGSGITNVVSGLGSPGDMVLSNSITAPAAAPAETASGSKYDVNGDGTVDNADSDAVTVAIAAGATDAKYDVNGDGTVNVFDLVEIIANRDPGAAGAPTLFGMKMSAAQIDSLQEQIDLLIATNDRSPAAMRTLIYLQQLLVTARPEKTLLLANYPNPFNPETWIPYELATDTDVRLTIYNTQGVVIRSLEFGHQSAGYYTGRDRAAYWDGRNALGERVASGLYFYQLETDEMSLMRKMVILK